MTHQFVIHLLISPQVARRPDSAAPERHDRFVMIERQHTRHWKALLANRQNVRIISEDIQNSIEKPAREYRRPEIAHALGVNGVMGGSLLLITSDAHRKVIR